MNADLKTLGWTRLATRLDDAALLKLSALGPHVGRGQRISDMDAVSACFPISFKQELEALGFDPSPRRAVGFVKTPEANWSLPWHQDRVVVKPTRNDDPLFTNWTNKAGLWHCEPPAQVLRKMAFLYVSFDAVEANGGGLEIAEGTHKFGKVEADDISQVISRGKICSPALEVGDILLISALTLHRSGLFQGVGSRRALRVDVSRSS